MGATVTEAGFACAGVDGSGGIVLESIEDIVVEADSVADALSVPDTFSRLLRPDEALWESVLC